MRKGTESSNTKAAANSQEGHLRYFVQQNILSMCIGGVLLILIVVFNLFMAATQSNTLETTTLLNQYRLGSKTLTSAVQSYAVTADEQFYDAYYKELNEDKNRDTAWNKLKKNHLNDSEWKSLNEIADLSNGLVPLEEEAFQAAQDGDTQPAMDAVFGDEYTNTVTQINEKTDDVISSIQSRMNKISSTFFVIQIILEIMLCAAFIFVMTKIIGLAKFAFYDLLAPIKKVSSYLGTFSQGNFEEDLDLNEDESEVGQMATSIHFMKQNLVGIIKEISAVLEQMGNGDYCIHIQHEFVGEFDEIKQSLDTICAKMRETFHTIQDVSTQVNSGSGQLANAASDLAEGCTVQAGKISDVLVQLNDLSGDLAQSASEAQKSVELSTNAGKIMMTGNENMNELKNAISEISQCSEEIRTIINTIDSIANQTNLLSLNAAIEAARAGEAGKGFAVVAEQVKTLAEESAKAAGETTKLIENTVAAVYRGISIADVTAENMNEVMQGAMEATQKMGQISTMLDENAANLHQITDNLSSISEIVDNNSAASEETAAVSQEQTAQVETMVGLLNQFKLS